MNVRLAIGAYVKAVDGEDMEYTYLQDGAPSDGEKYYFVSCAELQEK